TPRPTRAPSAAPPRSPPALAASSSPRPVLSLRFACTPAARLSALSLHDALPICHCDLPRSCLSVCALQTISLDDHVIEPCFYDSESVVAVSESDHAHVIPSLHVWLLVSTVHAVDTITL